MLAPHQLRDSRSVFGLSFTNSRATSTKSSLGAQRVLSGETPYTATPLPGLQWPIYYPVARPLARPALHGVALALGHATFCGISGACFGWAMSAEGDAKFFALATWPYVLSVSLGQWGPLLMATTAMPMLGWLAIVKPNLGLALAPWLRPSLDSSAGCVDQRGGVRSAVGDELRAEATVGYRMDRRALDAHSSPHHANASSRRFPPCCWLSSRWREPAARTLAALAFVPQTFSSYDSLLVFLVPRTRRESACSGGRDDER